MNRSTLLNGRAHPPLAPWLPPKPTLLQGIFFYQKAHTEELQLEKTRRRSARFSSTPASLHSRMQGGKSTVVNGLPTTLSQPQAKFCRASSSCRTENALVRIWSDWALMIKIPPNGRMPSCRILWFLKLTLHRTAMRMQKTSLVEEEEEEEEEVVFTRDNRGGSAQHATRATPTRSSHGPMRA